MAARTVRRMDAKVVKEFVITLLNRPGALGAFDVAMGRAGVRVSGYLLQGLGDTAVLRFVVEDPQGAVAWLQASGKTFATHEALAVPGEERAGFVGGLAERLGAAGVNIEASYPAILGGRGHVVFSVADAEAARKVLA